MKKVTAPGLLSLAMMMLLSCSKKSGDSPPDTSSNEVAATVQIGNAAPFGFSVTGAAAKIYQQFPGSSMYKIEATSTDNHLLFIFLGDVTGTGIYFFNSNTSFADKLEYHDLTTGSFYTTSTTPVSNNGSVTVTVLNNRLIAGTFTATAKSGAGETVTITNGTFNGGL